MKKADEFIIKYKNIQKLFEDVVKQAEMLRDKMMAQLMEEIQIPTNKLYRLRLEEHRDDRVHCFQAAQEGLVQVKKVSIQSFGDISFLIPECELVKLTPTGRIKYKKGKIDTKRIYNNWFLTWKLIDENDNVILSYEPEQHIIPGTYTDEELPARREQCLALQKF